MNNKLQEFARIEIKSGLTKLPKNYQKVFMQMYSFDNLKVDINDVVDKMSEDKLDWAMQQVQRSLDKLKKAKQKNE